MRCSKAGKYLSSYIDGELGPKEKVLLESHLAHCNRCTGELGQMRQLQELFSQSERFSAPPALRAKIMENIKNQPAKGFSLFPVFIRFAEVGAFVMAITAGVVSGSLLFNTFTPHHKGDLIVAALSLESLDALPPDSLGRAYLTMTEVRR